MLNRLRRWLVNRWMTSQDAEDFLIAAAIDNLEDPSEKDKVLAANIVRTEVRSVIVAVSNVVEWQWDQEQVIASRLSRLYDPGRALTEAMERAEVKIAEEKMSVPYSDKQRAALAFQAQRLRRIAARNATAKPTKIIARGDIMDQAEQILDAEQE